METGKYIWRDGKIVESDSKISIVNHAMHYGSGAFEGVRAYRTDDGRFAIFRLKEHTARLFYSGSVIELEIPFSKKEVCEAHTAVLRANNFDAESIYMRPMTMFGEGKMGLNPHGAEITTFIAAWPWGKYLSDAPITVGISPWIRIHPKSLQSDAKISGHYVNSIMSSLWAKKNNFQEALLLDYEGNLAEGPGENLFLVKDGKLLTPKLGKILGGITRASIMEVAKNELGLETIEKVLTPEDLFSADECFFTGTAAEVTLIASVDGKKIGKNNAVGEKIKKLYGEIVRGKIEKYHDWLTFV
jgi:branched-chain amino acid aminotransferase